MLKVIKKDNSIEGFEAGKIIAANMDNKANEKMVSDFIDQLDKDKIGGLPC